MEELTIFGGFKMIDNYLKKVSAMGIINGLKLAGIEFDEDYAAELANTIGDNIKFDPTSENDTYKVAALIVADWMEKVSNTPNKHPANTLENANTASALIEKLRGAIRNSVNYGKKRQGTQADKDKGLIGLLQSLSHDQQYDVKDIQTATQLIEKLRKGRDEVNKGVYGVGQQADAGKGIVGHEEKVASDKVSIDEIFDYLSR
jgi:hypothetical protein